MAEATLLIYDLAAAVTPAGSGPLRGREFGALRVHSPASIAVAGDRISAVGPPTEILRNLPSGADYESVDGRGKVALPGLVDCHAPGLPGRQGGRVRAALLRGYLRGDPCFRWRHSLDGCGDAGR